MSTPKIDKTKKSPVVSILNMKGGVGKTTISAHVFRLLYMRLKKSTLLIDFDPQFNLTQTVVSQPRYERIKASGNTILSVMEDTTAPSIFTVNVSSTQPPLEKDLSLVLRRLTTAPDSINLSLIPGDFGLTKYSLVENVTTLIPVKKRFLSFIEASRATRDLICIDCNPSSSFMTTCAVLASTHIIVPVRPDRYSLLGLEMLDDFLNRLPSLIKKPKLIILLNGIPSSGYDPTVENALRAHPRFGSLTMVNTLSISKLLEASPGYTGFATDRKVAYKAKLTKRISAIVDELAVHLGLVI